MFYTAASICLRAVADLNPIWVSCIKALPTVLLSGALVAFDRYTGLLRPLGWRLIASLIGAGLVAQLLGNSANQWSLAAIGLAVSTPLTFGSLIVSGAVLGRVWLGEPVTFRAALSIAVLLVAIPVLQWGAPAQPVAATITDGWDDWLTVAGVAMACVSGAAYALQAAVIRRVARGEPSLAQILFLFSSTGLVSLGLASIATLGPAGMLATGRADLSVMLLAGAFNAVAFYCLSKSLSLVPVVQANAINASQTAMAAVSGVVFFAEPFSWPLVAGVLLTLVGMLLLDHKKK